jgi:hypothetical protein
MIAQKEWREQEIQLGMLKVEYDRHKGAHRVQQTFEDPINDIKCEFFAHVKRLIALR